MRKKDIFIGLVITMLFLGGMSTMVENGGVKGLYADVFRVFGGESSLQESVGKVARTSKFPLFSVEELKVNYSPAGLAASQQAADQARRDMEMFDVEFDDE